MATPEDPASDTMLSRSGTSSPDGKMTARLDIPITERLESQIITLATLAGMSKAEWARAALDEFMNGRFGMVQRMAQGQSAGNGSNVPSGSERGR